MAVRERISEREYEAIVLREPDVQWELWDGQLREKPPMSWEHGSVNARLSYLLQHQLNWDEFHVRINEGHVRRSAERYYLPDIVVVPAALGDPFRNKPGALPVFRHPLPLVVEVWSPSTGDYDVDAKLPEYMARGDLEVWRIHPYEQTLTAWRRQPDGSYAESVYHEGIVRPASLPNVAIDLRVLFDA
jgi:Uma2 family endonuclease